MSAKERMRKYRERKRMARTLPRSCIQCGILFRPQRTTALYCSNVCRQKAHLKKARAARLREWYAPPKWSEWSDDETVITQIRSLDVRGPYLTRDELWLIAYVEVRNNFTSDGSIHVRVSSELTGGELVCWVEGPGYTTYKSGNPRLMTAVVAEVAENPKAAYTRARRYIKAAGGLHITGFDSYDSNPAVNSNQGEVNMIPQRWARRRQAWMYVGESETESDRRLASATDRSPRFEVVMPVRNPLNDPRPESNEPPVIGEQLDLL
jgi:hypothetical protein